MAKKAAAPPRPVPPYEAPEGARWEAVQAGPEWGVADPGRTCRWRGSRQPAACGAPAAVKVSRGVKRLVDWNYCGPHGLDRYGVWAEDSKVMRWKLADDPPEGGG